MDLVKILENFFEKEGTRCYVYGADDEGFLVSAIVNLRKIDSEVFEFGKCGLTEYVFIMKAREVLRGLLDNGAHILMNGDTIISWNPKLIISKEPRFISK
jgi:hypothetical protein